MLHYNGTFVSDGLKTGTEFTCFTSTKVQILTQRALLQAATCAACALLPNLLALLVQKYKY
jgi:hypothetical protein